MAISVTNRMLVVVAISVGITMVWTCVDLNPKSVELTYGTWLPVYNVSTD